MRLGGLPGSSAAMVAAALARSMPERPVVIVAPGPAEAERWLADLKHLTDLPTDYYPQRESLGEEEPHLEIAGERVETLDDLMRKSNQAAQATREPFTFYFAASLMFLAITLVSMAVRSSPLSPICLAIATAYCWTRKICWCVNWSFASIARARLRTVARYRFANCSLLSSRALFRAT